MKALKGLLIDVTGVLYESGSKVPIPSSVDAIGLLRKSEVPFRIVSNESQCSKAAFVKKLHGLGYTDLEDHEIFLPGPAAVSFMKANSLNPYLIVHPDAEVEFKDVVSDSPNCVVVGDSAEHFTFEKLNKGFNLLHRMAEPKLLCLGYGRYYKHGDGLLMDSGPFVEALKFAVGGDRVKPMLFGKPSPAYFNAGASDLRLEPKDVAMIGDDVNSDVGASIKCGMSGILVKTGKYTPGDELGKEHPPTAVVDNLLAAVNLALKYFQK